MLGLSSLWGYDSFIQACASWVLFSLYLRLAGGCFSIPALRICQSVKQVLVFSSASLCPNTSRLSTCPPCIRKFEIRTEVSKIKAGIPNLTGDFEIIMRYQCSWLLVGKKDVTTVLLLHWMNMVREGKFDRLVKFHDK